jgi:hypothetical protein
MQVVLKKIAAGGLAAALEGEFLLRVADCC